MPKLLLSVQREVKYALIFYFNAMFSLIFTEHLTKIIKRSLQGIQLHLSIPSRTKVWKLLSKNLCFERRIRKPSKPLQ